MNSIFFRIYAGMLVAMLLVGAASWGLVEFVNTYRADNYRERLAQGTFWLVANGTARRQGDERARWLQVVSAVLGTPVSVLDDNQASVSEDERDRLDGGRMVFRLGKGDEEAATLLTRVPGEPRVVSATLDRLSEQQWRATAALVLEEFGRHPRDEWDRVQAEVQAHFGYPVGRQGVGVVQLDEGQMQRLRAREVVITLTEGGPRAESGIRVHAPMGNTGEVLVLGPMQLFDRLPMQMVVPLGALGLLAMGLAAYLLVRPLELKLRRLERAVHEVSAGNLAARAEVSGQDAVAQLAASFNGMTAHIARLIQSQREMTRAVSHELRTPVARIRFGLEMLADIDAPAQRVTKIAAIDQDIDQLDALIDEILTYARLEEGSPVLEWTAVDVAALARQLGEELAPLAPGLRIEVDVPGVLVADGEERYLHRVLQNLVTNAMRYARSRIQVRCELHGTQVEVVVEDDGPGIPEVDRERVFKPFARLDDSRHRASGGYGLGLSIVQRIAEWHGGRIWVDTAALGGAAFHLRWPRQRHAAHVLGAGNTEPGQ